MRICDAQQLLSQDVLYGDDMRLLGQDMKAPFPYQRRYSTAIATMGYESAADSGKKKAPSKWTGHIRSPNWIRTSNPSINSRVLCR